MFSPEEQEVVRIRLADSLAAVISQRLLPNADGKGRVAALEVMLCTATIRDLIRDRNRVGEIKDYIEEGREQYGMQSFDQHLMELVETGTVTFETAKAAASNPSDFELKLQTFRRLSQLGTKAVTEEEVPSEEPAAKKEDDLPDGFTPGGFDVMGQ
jgi:twitching motility protein PilT